MDLHFRRYGTSERNLIILHGLFGSSDNWATLARAWSEMYSVYCIDLRNHGQSPHNTEHTYAAMADDLEQFFRSHGISKAAIIGHSMGGKVAMEFALRPENTAFLEKLIVVDISPRAYPPHHQRELGAMLAVPVTTLKNRQEAEVILAKHISEPSIIQFIMKGLYRTEDGRFHWRFNLNVLADTIKNIGDETRKGVCSVPTLFIKGGKSDFYIKLEDTELILQRFPNASIQTISNAGHWVQAEQPQLFKSTVDAFLAT